MKIILVHNTYQQPGGEDIVVEQEKRILERAGHRVILYGRSNHEINDLSVFERLAMPKRMIWASDTKREFALLLARESPNLVHVHNTFLMISPSIYSACREWGVPVVQTLHNFRLLCPAATFFRDGQVCEECLDHGLWRGISHGCYHDSRTATASIALMLAWHTWLNTWDDLVDCYVALSEFARAKFIAGGLAGGKIVVKPNFVDPDPGMRESAGDYAVFVGRLSKEKGLPTLLRAWTRFGGSLPLELIGDGSERGNLEVHARDDPNSQITFRGHLPREATVAAVKGARFLVLPSECYENFPMSIVEAFACGTPVICSRLGGMQELVSDHRTGLHFTAGDADDLARKVEWALNHPSELALMGLEARHEYETRYTAERNYSFLMDIYQRTTNAYA
jgi:glycosyltransferase involved in cell wall biosynthesis